MSAGILVWRRGDAGPELLLVHPGGPFWRGKDLEAWSIPKGLVAPGEELLAAALREVEEELGQPVAGHFVALAPCRTAGGKWVHAWLVEADLDLTDLRSNLFENGVAAPLRPPLQLPRSGPGSLPHAGGGADQDPSRTAAYS